MGIMWSPCGALTPLSLTPLPTTWGANALAEEKGLLRSHVCREVMTLIAAGIIRAPDSVQASDLPDR